MTNFDLNDNTTIPVTGFGVFMVPNKGPTEEAVGKKCRHYSMT